MPELRHHPPPPDTGGRDEIDREPMTIVAEGDLRGETVVLLWENGMLQGDIGLLDRVRARYEDADMPCDLTDPIGFMTALRAVFGDRLRFTVS